jgi:DNA-directed RNA polymerase specialized sigma24 family protein
MPRNLDMSQEELDDILAWLDANRERAGEKYEELRVSLIKIFSWNHCLDPEGMADETFNRVGRRAGSLISNYSGDPRLYFYAVANNQIKESHKKVNPHVPLGELDPAAPAPVEEDVGAELRRECFHQCLQALSSENRALIVDYYLMEKQAKINHRKEMAHRLGVAVGALRVRMCRIRADLERCVAHCLEQQARQ